MARAVLVCSDCGKQLAETDLFCSQCGSKVERGDDPAAVKPAATPAMCEACGHTNFAGEHYCESCGAKLPGGSIEAEKKPGPVKSSPKPKHAKQSLAFKFEIWHYVLGIVVIGIVGFFIYEESQREYAEPVKQQTVPLNFPSAVQQPTSPPSQESLDGIARLETVVKENPNDSGSKILLANALHDAAIHDGTLFPKAIEAYRSYLKEKPGDPNARIDLGICYFELGKIDSTQRARLFSDAINEMESTMESNPKHQAGAFNLGIVYLYSGNLHDSNKWLQKTVNLNPESDLGKRAKSILDQHLQAG